MSQAWHTCGNVYRNVKPIEEIVAGDLLMGPDSKPRTVLSTTRGHGPMYRITPTKGDSWECNDVHVLTLVRTNEHHSKAQRGGEIIDVPLNEWLEWGPQRKILYKMFHVGVDFPEQPAPPVEPYLLGILLGDGGLTVSVEISNSDPEIIEYCRGAATRWECELRDAAYVVYRFSTRRSDRRNALKDALRELGVFGHKSIEKFVPSSYRIASRQDRLELLAGLMDTDGHLAQGHFDYVTGSQQLAEDVAFIARSVGLAAYIKQVRKGIKSTGFVGDYFRLSICGHVDIIPTKVARKQAQPRQQKKDVLRTAFEAEPVGEDDYYGFTLDGDGRYLLGDFTVTHNTLTCAWIARHFRRRGWNVFSTAGLLFGQRFDLADAYSFPDHVTPGGFMFADEVHTLVDRYSSNSVRGRTFGQSSTAMRKEEITCVGASAHTVMVGWEYKGVSECVMIPQRWYSKSKLHAPPFCHIGVNKMFPFPYKRKDQLLMGAGLVAGSDQKIAYWRPSPQELMGAAKLMDSFESVHIGENFSLDAKAMKAARDGQSQAKDEPPNLVYVVRRVWDAGYIRAGESVYFTTIRDVIQQAGLKVSATAIRSALEMAGCDVKSASVHEGDLAIMFETMDTESALDRK